MRLLLRLSILTVFLGFSISLAQNIDEAPSKVTFELKNFGVNTVEGSFQGMQGTVIFDRSAPEKGSFSVCIDAATVQTGIEARDEHILGEDYFNVAQYPEICFVSSEIYATGQGFETLGKLSLNGITQEVAIAFTVEGNTLTGALTIDRTDYKVGPNNGFTIEKEIDMVITCVLE